MIIAVRAAAVNLRIARLVVIVSFIFLLDRTNFLPLIFFQVAYYVAYKISLLLIYFKCSSLRRRKFALSRPKNRVATLLRCGSFSQKIFASQIFFGNPSRSLVRTR